MARIETAWVLKPEKAPAWPRSISTGFCVANQIKFWVPAAGAPKKKAVSFTGDLATFKAQFVQASPDVPPFRVPPAAFDLSVAALNSGYGAVVDEMLGVTDDDWRQLQRYLTERLSLLMSLLETSSTPSLLRRASIVTLLETSELGGMSYLLGSIFCRIATERWANLFHRGAVERYWHLKVSMDAAVCLMPRIRASMTKAENPDFVFETNRGWFTAEAKGTFGTESWAKLKGGLRQARKIERVAFYDIELFDTKNEPIRSSTCTMAHFDSAQELQVTHLDCTVWPPEEPQTLTLVKEFADLVQFEQAFEQFAHLSQGIDLPPQWPAELAEADWRLMRYDADPAARIYLGLPLNLAALKRPLQLALRALRLIVPMVALRISTPSAESTKTRSTSARDQKKLGRQLRAEAEQANASERAFWRGLEEAVAEPVADKSTKQFWQTVLQQVATVPRLPRDAEGDNLVSIIGLASELRIIGGSAGMEVALQRPDSSALRMARTDQGLLVAAGTWRGRPPQPNRRVQKI